MPISAKIRTQIELLLFYILPPFLFIGGFLSVHERFFVFGFTGLCILLFNFKRIKFSELIQNTSLELNEWKFFILSLIGSLLILQLLNLTAEFSNYSRIILFAIAYICLSVPFQEFFFRYYFFKRYSAVLSKEVIVILNTISFSIYHLVYGEIQIIWLCIPAGLFLAYSYQRNKNFLNVLFYHSIYGLLLIGFGYVHYFTTLLN